MVFKCIINLNKCGSDERKFKEFDEFQCSLKNVISNDEYDGVKHDNKGRNRPSTKSVLITG